MKMKKNSLILLAVLFSVAVIGFIVWAILSMNSLKCGENRAKEIATDWILENSLTYKFDGYGLGFDSLKKLDCDKCYELSFWFDSRHAGYGARTNMVLAQVITPHKIIVKINQCKIMDAINDGRFDELKNKLIIPSSLGIEILKQGEGEQAKTGDRVSVNYSGRLLDGKEFDSNFGKDSPFIFVLGAGRVIEGWDLGLLGMRVGERRKLTIPPELAYGNTGTPGGPIPPSATLIFEVELLSINN